MKNNSNEIINNENNISIFQGAKQNQTTQEPSKIINPNKSDSIILTEVSNKSNKKKFLFSLKNKIIFIIIYYIIIISIEFLYRDFLFTESIIIQEKIHRNQNNLLLLKISKIISLFGSEISTLVFYGIIFLFMPFNYSFIILQSIVYATYFTNTLKMIYQSDRPNWHSEYLTFSCNYGYGNPSGHSFTSVSLYLCLAHIFVKYFKIKDVLKILIFAFFIIGSILIIISRVILAAHSINQILYGALLGLGLYFILIFIIGYHNYSCVDFYQHFKHKKIKKIYYSFHIFLLILTVFIYIFSKDRDHTEINNKVFNNKRCEMKNDYKMYKNDGLFQALSITSILGAQLGFDLLFTFLKIKNYMITYSIIEWNKLKKIKHVFLRFFVIIFSSIGIIFYFIIPGNINLILIFIFKSAFSFFLAMFGIHFIGIYLCIKLKIANREIYKMNALHEITAEA